jgi:L,D-peptidoglycan transpeptidase YkuD (ErfK/YbiS/YcfS/YnhG family)
MVPGTMLRILLICALAGLPAAAFELPRRSSQLVVGIAPGWNSSRATLQRYQRTASGWLAIGRPVAARIGRDGLAWGLGLHPLPEGAGLKAEGDWRAPAGVFRIGGVWGYPESIRKHPKLFYHRVTPRDLWVEDPASPSYNRHVVLDHDPATRWEKKQQMRQDDDAHALKLFIAHNAPPKAVPGRGSSIFFHIWRGGGSKPTAGCTTMPESALRELIAWLDPGRQPLYVLLPAADYQRLKEAWQLP